MPITKFKISTSPERSIITISSIPFVLNQEYPISKQSEMIASVIGRGVPYDSFGFKLGNEKGIWSSEQFCSINAEVGSGSPILSDLDLTIKLNEVTSILNNFSFDNNTDRIIFKSTEPPVYPRYGTFKINGINLILNKTYYLYELNSLKWFSSYVGILQNVETNVYFKVGNKNEWSNDYTLTLKSSANLQCIINSDNDDLTGTLTNTTP